MQQKEAFQDVFLIYKVPAMKTDNGSDQHVRDELILHYQHFEELYLHYSTPSIT